MPDFRCPKHDLIFNASVDTRPPGSAGNRDKGLAAHPANGHPECPMCAAESKPAARSGNVVSNV